MLQRFFQRYTGLLRAFKPLYILNNILNRSKLQHNKSLYQKYGFKKSIYEPICNADFKEHNPEIPWIDQPDALEKIMQHADFEHFTPDVQQQILHFVENGYMILRGWLSPEKVDDINADIDRLLQSGKTDFNFTGRKIMAAFNQSDIINHYFRQPEMLHLLSFLLGKKALPFHTINFLEGSEQRAHSDSIHMTTEPEGYLIATWTALEDCTDENGPLFYYPKSHRLPFIMSNNFDSGSSRWLLGAESNKRYEDKIEAVIQNNTFLKEYFYAKKGDVLIWHANLIHGGSPIKTKGTTRKSMVAHYFAEGVICYHELTQRPALINKDKQ
jgi:ectoine hydroxylase